jgi:hypothetical protein
MNEHRTAPARSTKRFGALRSGAIALAVACAICSNALASAPREARQLVRQGNTALRGGDAEGALKTYQQALEADPDSLEAKFNKGVAEYAAKNSEGARDQFRLVDASGGNPELAAAARYNLGIIESADASKGEGEAPALPDKVLERLKGAAGLFRSSLDLAPRDPDAARNLELTRRRIKDVQDYIKQQQNMQQAMQDLKDKLDQNQKDQQQQAQQSQQRQDQQQKPTEQDKQEQQKSSEATQQAAEQLQQMMEQNQDLQQQAQQSDDTKGGAQQQQQQQMQMEQARQSLDEAREAQERAEQAQQKGEAGEAQKAQQEAAEKLQEALQKLGAKSQGDQKEDKESQQEQGEQEEQQDEGEQEEQQQAQEQQEQQAQEGKDQMGNEGGKEQPTDQRMARILEKEKRDREYRQEMLRRQMSRNAPVEKDW